MKIINRAAIWFGTFVFLKILRETTSSAIAIMSLTDTNGTCTSSILPYHKKPTQDLPQGGTVIEKH